MDTNNRMEKIISLTKRRGFIFQSGEIYGGLQGFWDFGPLGVELKNNIKKSWWKRFVQGRANVVGQDAAIITNPTVWKKSGHVGAFGDYLMECRKEKCHRRYKAEDILPKEIQKKLINNVKELGFLLEKGEIIAEQAMERESNFAKSLVSEINKQVVCQNCQNSDWTEPRMVNGMFQTAIGPVASSAELAYLRPETAQNIFVNFELVRQSMRLKIPFGIGQIGKAFRNEITPGNFIFRSREFEQMELEYFINPKEDEKEFKTWVDASMQWFLDLGIKKENLRFFEQPKSELAHYSKATTDIEYKFPFSGKVGSGSAGDKGWAELMGIANRTDFDLKAHGLSYRDEATNETFVPYVIEPSAGVDRAALAFLIDAYTEISGGRSTTTESNKEQEVVLRLHKELAPIKVAVLPLSKKDEVSGPAKEIAQTLRQQWTIQYDDVASIGRRYRRQDEIGTPYCVTYDFDSNTDKQVTVRDRDTMTQERVPIGELVEYLEKKLSS